MRDLTTAQVNLIRLRDDLEFHARHAAKVLSKDGRLVPLIFNKAQRFIHERLEEQLRECGLVRALILKGRQQGASTYIGERFYHRTSMNSGRRAFIVAHEEKATTNLFDMVKRYQLNNSFAPSIKASNAQELVFGKLDSGYKLATAGSKDVGRSNTAQLLHGSEFGFWANAQMHLAGIGNTIPSGTQGLGTEIILESTGNGLGNAFHLMWQDAEAGKGEYIAIFVPWFWQDEYRTKPRADFQLSKEDAEYQGAHGLDLSQMQWRHNKIVEYGEGFAWLFDQEYPALAAVAFKTSTMNPLISPSAVMAAVNSEYLSLESPLVIGCDPAGDGEGKGDRTAVAFRSGRTCFRVEYHEKLSTMQIAGKLAGYWIDGVACHGQQLYPSALFVDKGGLGAGIVDRLLELNIPVIGVSFAQQASSPELYLNKRAEIWWSMRAWFGDAPCRIPNDNSLVADICAPQPIENSMNRRQLESKKEMAKRQIRSPDGGDALALTFAAPVAFRAGVQNPREPERPATTAGY